MEQKRLIAINTMHTGNGRYDNRGYAVTKTSEQVDSLLSEDWLRKRDDVCLCAVIVVEA